MVFLQEFVTLRYSKSWTVKKALEDAQSALKSVIPEELISFSLSSKDEKESRVVKFDLEAHIGYQPERDKELYEALMNAGAHSGADSYNAFTDIEQ